MNTSEIRPWRSQNDGVIGLVEWWGLLPRSLVFQARHAHGLGRYLLGARGGDLDPIPPPTSPWVDAALDLAEGTLSAQLLAHSHRTWEFADALSRADGRPVDRELLLVASLLHDIGLCGSGRRAPFEVSGAHLAESTVTGLGLDPDKVQAVASAIVGHVSLPPGTELGRYIQDGSLADVIGWRIWDLPPETVSRACRDHPRRGFPKAVRRAWRVECDLFPHSRAAYARWPGLLPAATYAAPLPR